MSISKEQLDECINALNAKDYYNGGQTVRGRYEIGSQARANIIAEANFWLKMVQHEQALERQSELSSGGYIRD